MNNNNNFSNLCRLCTNPKDDLISIFDKQSSSLNLVKMITDNLSLSVEESDSLPQKICLLCKKTLESFNAFRQSCSSAEKFLKNTLGDKSSFLLEPECTLKEGETTIVLEEPQKSHIDSKMLQDINIKKEADDHDERRDTLHEELPSNVLETGKQHIGNSIKEPCQDDYILVKEETFTLNNSEKRKSSTSVEFLNPNIKTSDRELIALAKERTVLPQMWDVYEKQTNNNSTVVTMRRYIISKAAFSCSLCNNCIPLKHEEVTVEEDEWAVNYGTEHSDAIEICAGEADDDAIIASKIKTEDNGSLTFETETWEIMPTMSGTDADTGVELSCEICKKPFPRHTSLKRHMRTHFEYKSLPCKLCGKGFSRKEHLSRHMMLHAGDRPYVCEICQKTFTRKEHLTRHQLIHKEGHSVKMGRTFPNNYKEGLTSGKNVLGSVGNVTAGEGFSCAVCHATFAQRNHLMQHICHAQGSSHTGQVPSSNAPPVKRRRASAALPVNPNEGFAKSSEEVEASVIPVKHEGRDLYLCNLCPRSFSRAAHLARHNRIHIRDFMFVNEGRVPGTDITLSLINANPRDNAVFFGQ